MASNNNKDINHSLLKRKKKVLSLTQKVILLDRLARGESMASVGRRYGVNESTMRYIKKCEDSIRASIAAGAPSSAKVSYVSRDPKMAKMEKLLNVWIEEQGKNNVLLTGPIVREEAKRLYDELVQAAGEGSSPNNSFLASKGWFENFKKRYSFQYVRMMGNPMSPDDQSCPPRLIKVVEDKGYEDDTFADDDIDPLLESNENGEYPIDKNDRQKNGRKKKIKTDSNKPPLDSDVLSEIFKLAEILSDKVSEADPLLKRSIKFVKVLEGALQPYKKEYEKINEIPNFQISADAITFVPLMENNEPSSPESAMPARSFRAPEDIKEEPSSP